jgi:hypothetical protein
MGGGACRRAPPPCLRSTLRIEHQVETCDQPVRWTGGRLSPLSVRSKLTDRMTTCWLPLWAERRTSRVPSQDLVTSRDTQTPTLAVPEPVSVYLTPRPSPVSAMTDEERRRYAEEVWRALGETLGRAGR